MHRLPPPWFEQKSEALRAPLAHPAVVHRFPPPWFEQNPVAPWTLFVHCGKVQFFHFLMALPATSI